ncbi:hypothetical protein J6590_026450 [Homalodisca vitripennis]|nr:hypothetical protein J6590_026450 [Homalodisca vitripennis]
MDCEITQLRFNMPNILSRWMVRELSYDLHAQHPGGVGLLLCGVGCLLVQMDAQHHVQMDCERTQLCFDMLNILSSRMVREHSYDLSCSTSCPNRRWIVIEHSYDFVWWWWGCLTCPTSCPDGCRPSICGTEAIITAAVSAARRVATAYTRPTSPLHINIPFMTYKTHYLIYSAHVYHVLRISISAE